MCPNLIPSTAALDLQHGHFVPNIQLSFVCFYHNRRTDTHALPLKDAVLVKMFRGQGTFHPGYDGLKLRVWTMHILLLFFFHPSVRISCGPLCRTVIFCDEILYLSVPYTVSEVKIFKYTLCSDHCLILSCLSSVVGEIWWKWNEVHWWPSRKIKIQWILTCSYYHLY